MWANKGLKMGDYPELFSHDVIAWWHVTGMMSLQESLQQRVKRRRRRDDRNRGWRKGHKPKKQGSL